MTLQPRKPHEGPIEYLTRHGLEVRCTQGGVVAQRPGEFWRAATAEALVAFVGSAP